jgi:hypothetical protein
MMAMARGKTCLNNERGYHWVILQTEIDFVYKNLNIFRNTSASSGVTQPIHFFNHDDAQVVRNILSFISFNETT